jgi:hypothetical protein
MSINRVVAATVVAAAAIGVPGSALAIGSAGHGSKAAAPPAATACPSKASGLSDLSALAASAGITESRLESGLVAVKQAGGNTAAAVTGFARATGVSPAAAQRIINSIFAGQTGRGLTTQAAAGALATRLGVSTAAARTALEQLGTLSRASGVDPTSAAFAHIAHQLGVTPARLASALDVFKEAQRAAAR